MEPEPGRGGAAPLSFLKSSASSLSVTISFMLMMLLWLSCLRILISLMAVMGKPSFSLSSRTFFSATISPGQRPDRNHDRSVQDAECSRAVPSSPTCVFVLGFVHLAVGAFTCDPQNLKLVHAPFAPVDLGFLEFSVSGAADSGQKKKKT